MRGILYAWYAICVVYMANNKKQLNEGSTYCWLTKNSTW